MSKVILKMTFKHPNRKDTSNKNSKHVVYIATRPGVDKSLTSNDLKNVLNSNVDDADIGANNQNYTKYIHERPHSHGLFDATGVADLDLIKDELKAANSYVWRYIISLKEVDAKELGYMDKEKWLDTIRNKVPDMAREMNIRLDNLRWVGAVHMEKGHPHTHVIIWENEPEKRLGVISEKRLTNMRKAITDEIFSEERISLLAEKDIMRDLIRDLASGDVGQAARLLKEVKETNVELRSLDPGENKEGVPPKLYSEDEIELAEKIKLLSDMLPGHGRVMLKFMPGNVKDMVRSISDWLLEKHEFAASLQRNLNAVENLTKMYTGKQDAIDSAREKAHNDIRDRVSQVILKGAVESRKVDNLYVDAELATNAVNVLKNIDNQIDILPERTEVIRRVGIALIKSGYNDEQILKVLNDFSSSDNIMLPGMSMNKLIDNLHKEVTVADEFGVTSSAKKINFYLSALKLAGNEEESAFSLIRETIRNDSRVLEMQLEKLAANGYLNNYGGIYDLTQKGLVEFLGVKTLDKSQQEIMRVLAKEGAAGYSELLEDKDIFGNLIEKDPQEFKIGKYDLKIREEFGDINKITLDALEDNIFDRYTTGDVTNVERAEKEFEIIKNRIEKLCLNGYVELDRATGVYSFTQDGLEELEHLTDKMEFTRYDADVTLGYIDRTETGVLHKNDLEKTIKEEIVNLEAKMCYESFTEIIEQGSDREFIKVDSEGYITATAEGQKLSKELNSLNRVFAAAEGELTEDKLLDYCKETFNPEEVDKKYDFYIGKVKTLVSKGYILETEDGSFFHDSHYKNVKNFLYHVYKQGGSIPKDNLKEILENNIPNTEAEYRIKYFLKRLDFLVKEGYLTIQEGGYKITPAGIEKRADLLVPERGYLKNELRYLSKIGFIDVVENKYVSTKKFEDYSKSVLRAKDQGVERGSSIFSKSIAQLVDQTLNNVNVSKIRRASERLAIGKYISGEYSDIKCDYSAIRGYCNVPDLMAKTLTNMTITLLASGVNLEDTKALLNIWNERTGLNTQTETLNEIIDKTHSIFSENQRWGKLTVVSAKDWKDMFEALGLEDPPTWMYRGVNWQLFHGNIGLSIVNDIWKSVWKSLERDRLRTEAQAEMLKKNLVKQQAASQSIAAIKEEAKKAKDGSGYEPNID